MRSRSWGVVNGATHDGFCGDTQGKGPCEPGTKGPPDASFFTMGASAGMTRARGMLATSAPSTVRRVLASASLGASAVGVGWLGVSMARYFEPSMLAVALAIGASIGVAAVGLSRRSVLTQVLSRGVAWVVLTPALLGLADSLGRGHLPGRHVLFLAMTSAGALVLARPALHADAAKAE